jgi:hypothetical protein
MWGIEADLLTPTFKLKRPQLLKKYQAQVRLGKRAEHVLARADATVNPG